MMLGRISSRQNLQVTNAVGSKAKGKRSPASPARKVPVAPGSNKKGRARGDGDSKALTSQNMPQLQQNMRCRDRFNSSVTSPLLPYMDSYVSLAMTCKSQAKRSILNPS